MSILLKGVNMPKPHFIDGYYVDSDGTFMNLNRTHVIGKAVEVSDINAETIKETIEHLNRII